MIDNGLPSAPSAHHRGGLDRLGPPMGGPAQELIDSGFALENADAPLLHTGLNLADIAHVIDLHERGVIPHAAAEQLMRVLLKAVRTSAEDFPYDPAFGEPYNSRERYFTAQIGSDAGWLHAGRPRREAVRIALRLHVRSVLEDLVEDAAELAHAIAVVAAEHSRTWLPDQTYLQHAQPSTFGHYLVSFAYPVLRDAERLMDAFEWVNTSPGGAGCVNGSRLLADRSRVASLLGFEGFIEHTRDAMWQIDGLIAALSHASSLLTTQSKLAEDLEIWASNEFDYVTIADGFSRSSVLMPQKRNPYALSIIRGAAGTLIGRLTGFLAVSKSPSARSDNLIYAYGEIPRALDLARRTTRLTSGVVRSLTVNADQMWAALESGFSQATDLAEFVMQTCHLDYRTAYQVVGIAVREASREGLRGIDLDGARLEAAAQQHAGISLGLEGQDLSDILDPRHIVETRTLAGGAAPPVVETMAAECVKKAKSLRDRARAQRTSFEQAEAALVAEAGDFIEGESDDRS
ncbi:argininosuccinate lyase [Streptosporangium sp. NBC_01810]|uniref:argininosuccinate lyase n=1 Tax=Streptosporangium sp. NBC_01810 TaxID=2975951 RepID=UPI002DD9EEB1|nr:argininosuccinate lyase [Streptosporangium sp. NBC_01810]WSA26451.1 argininosuccinate lyase [Streptosporangium sp. NBC_01810]